MTKLGYTSDLIVEPVLFGIKNNLIDHDFELIELPEEEILSALLDRKLDMGLISPLHFAHTNGELSVFRDIAVASEPRGKNALLFFQENIRHFGSIYYPEYLEGSFGLFLARVVLSEFLDIEAEWKITDSSISIEEATRKFPVYFFAGENIFRSPVFPDNYIDLTEEWWIKTQFPLVHKIIAIQNNFADIEALAKLKLSRDLGIKNLTQISEVSATGTGVTWDSIFELLNENYKYYPNIDTWESLRELFQFIFYYGESEHFPEIKFFRSD